jgi:hypothetical protein
MAYTFVLSDNSLNDYKFRILTEGLRLDRFKSNPIMLWMHQRDEGGIFSSETLPIGKWENIRTDGDKLLADAIFDENDPFALTIKDKVDQKILVMASIGVSIITVSEDPAVMLPGQTRPTVTEGDVVEASIVDIGANANALRLYKREVLSLSLTNVPTELPEISNKPNSNNMKKFLMAKLLVVAAFLGFKPEDEVEITQEHLEKVDAELKLRADSITTLTTERDQARTELAAAKTAKETAEAALATANTSIATLTTENGTLKTDNAALKVQAGAPPASVTAKTETGDHSEEGKDADAEFCASHSMAENVAYLRAKRQPKTA